MKLLTYENLTHIVTQCINELKLHLSTPTTGRPLKIDQKDALVLALYQHASTRCTKKSVYDDFKETLNCSYKTLVVAMNKAGMLALRILYFLMRIGKKHAHIVKYTDAT